MRKTVKAEIEDVRDLMSIYDSANQLFCKEDRADADLDTFYKMLDESNVYIMYEDIQMPIAFMAFVEKEKYTEMIALYIKTEYQRIGLGQEFISYFEKLNTGNNRILIIRALKNAPWALQFYKKNGYKEIGHKMAIELNMKEHPWSIILFKIIE